MRSYRTSSNYTSNSYNAGISSSSKKTTTSNTGNSGRESGAATNRTQKVSAKVKAKEAAKKAIDDNFSHYTPVPGLPELRSAIVQKFKRDNDLEFTPDQIVTSTGAKQSLANLC